MVEMLHMVQSDLLNLNCLSHWAGSSGVQNPTELKRALIREPATARPLGLYRVVFKLSERSGS